MKNIKSILILLFISSFIMSCKKDLMSVGDPSITPINSFKEIKTSTNFDWKTSAPVLINITPIPTLSNITNTLLIKTENGDVVFSKLQTMSESFSGEVLVPTKIKKLVVSFGSISKTLDIENNQINFNYLVQ